MLKAPPKSWIRFGFKLGVAGAILELAALGGSYVFWRKLNRDQGESQKHHICIEKSFIIIASSSLP